MEQPTQTDAYTVPPRTEAKAVLASGLSLLRIGLGQVFSALWTLLAGGWLGHVQS